MELNERKQLIALLTEVLPYELPLRINNEAFFANVMDEEVSLLFNEFAGVHGYTKPLNYYIRKYGGDKLRQLSLMHPDVQIQFAKLYNDYSDIMIYFSKRSPFSLRHIEDLAKHYLVFEESKCSDTVIELKDEDETQDEFYKSFFVYKECDFSFRFFEGFPFVKLEQKYKYIRFLDIANCFYNIYTHSFCWAVKGKDNSKSYTNKSSFDNKFDRLMQLSNYNETDGIIVGPEVSRIFAEIILQRIDLGIIERLKKHNLRLGYDYEIRRYVDDYLVFSNKTDDLDLIEKEVSKELVYFKLYLNESKTKTVSRPFLTKETKAKIETKDLFFDFIEKYYKKTDNPLNGNKIDKTTLKMLHSFSIIAESNGVNYGVINRVLLSSIKGFLSGCDGASVNDKTVNVFIVIAEIAFFVFNLDMCASSSLKLSSIIYKLKDLLAKDEQMLLRLKEKTIRQLKSTIDIYMNTKMGDETNLEIQNILILMCDVWGFLLPEELLFDLFSLDSGSTLDYFQICSLLYLAKDNPDYKRTVAVVNKAVQEKFKNKKDQCKKRDTELTYLFFDYMTCPWVGDNEKEKIITCFCGSKDDPLTLLTKLKSVKRWFFDWDSTHDIREFIKKKEYRNPYN